MADTVRTRHTVSGVIDNNTPLHLIEHPIFGRYLEVVDDDAKPFLPELHKPREAKAPEEPKVEIEKVEATAKKNGKD